MSEPAAAETSRFPIGLIIVVLGALLVLASMLVHDDADVVDCLTSRLDPRTGEVVDARPSMAAANPDLRTRDNGLTVTTCDD